MTSRYIGSNKGVSTVATGFNASATTFTVATGEGARFPSPTGGNYTLIVLQNTAGVREIVCVVGRTADVMTVGIPGSAAANVLGRNYETIYGMTAAAWVTGDVVACRPTAALIEAGVNFGGSIAAATNKATPVNADTFALSDSADSDASKKVTLANLKATLFAAWGALTTAGTSKATPVDADSLAICDSAASDATKKLTWANVKATLKTYLDTLYMPVAPGMIFDFGGSAAPTGYLACNGAAVSRTTYSALFTAIGTLWGAGDGSTTFNVPSFAAGDAGVQTAGTVGASTDGVMPAHTYTDAVIAGDDLISTGWVPPPVGLHSLCVQDKTALPMIPQPLIPGGPLIMVAEFLVNKSAFTGKELTKETDTWVEKAAKVGGHFYKGFAPNVPIPYSGTWAGTKIDNAVKGKEDPLGRAYPVPEAIASGFGLKLERYPVDTLQRNTVLDMKGKLRELSDEQRQAARDYGRQGMTKRELDDKVGEIVGKKNAAVEEYKAKERKAMGKTAP